MSTVTRLQQLRMASLGCLGKQDIPTGIFKVPVDAARLTKAGLEGDAQGDTKHHGGPEKALHHYAAEHYAWWASELPSAAAQHCKPGAFGENLVTTGMTESSVCIGDVYQLGRAVVQVSQARQPCWRLNLRFGIDDMSQRLQTSLKTGWYYRVILSGLIQAGDEITLLERPHPDWTLSRLLNVFYQHTLNYPELEAIAGLPELADSWRAVAQKRLTVGKVEDWQFRLRGA